MQKQGSGLKKVPAVTKPYSGGLNITAIVPAAGQFASGLLPALNDRGIRAARGTGWYACR